MVGKSDSEPVTCRSGADLPQDLIVGRVKLYRKSHDQIGRYRMGLGEKTASLGKYSCSAVTSFTRSEERKSFSVISLNE